jgi:hypothetical protein
MIFETIRRNLNRYPLKLNSQNIILRKLEPDTNIFYVLNNKCDTG